MGHQEQWRRSWLRIANINTWQSVLKSLCVMVLHSIVWIHVEASPGHGNVGPEKQTWQVSYKCKSILWRATPGRRWYSGVSVPKPATLWKYLSLFSLPHLFIPLKFHHLGFSLSTIPCTAPGLPAQIQHISSRHRQQLVNRDHVGLWELQTLIDQLGPVVPQKHLRYSHNTLLVQQKWMMGTGWKNNTSCPCTKPHTLLPISQIKELIE